MANPEQRAEIEGYLEADILVWIRGVKSWENGVCVRQRGNKYQRHQMRQSMSIMETKSKVLDCFSRIYICTYL